MFRPTGPKVLVGLVVPMGKGAWTTKNTVLKNGGLVKNIALSHAQIMDSLQTLIAIPSKVNTLMLTLQYLKSLLILIF